jgi:hypothetical protein
MRKILLAALFGAAILATLLTTTGCPVGKSKLEKAIQTAAEHPGMVVRSHEVRQETPGGSIHYGKSALDAAKLADIDAGVQLLEDAAKEDGFNEPLPRSSYVVFTPPYNCVKSPVQQAWAFLVGGGAWYDGTDYDQYNPNGKLAKPFTDEEGRNQVWEKDGRSAIYAAEMVFSFQPVEMYVCKEDMVNAVRHGADHGYLANRPYSEENRSRPPYDVWTYFNCSLYHGSVIHPLLPRGGRCAESVEGDSLVKLGDLLPLERGKDVPLSPDQQDLARSLGVDVSPGDRLAPGRVVRAVK